jgi:polysaccharide export outer membrane protein
MRIKVNSIYLMFFLFSSIGCIPQKNIIYFQGAQNQDSINAVPQYGSQYYEYIIGPTDILSVQIDGVDDAVFAAFKPNVADAGFGRPIDRGLLVNKYGQIQLPYLGKIKVSGLTLAQATDTLQSRLLQYITDTTLMYVNVKTLSFPVTVIGEVVRPGIYQADNEFMTVTELLAKSGDLTQYGNRKNIKLYRTDRETKQTTVYLLDLTRKELVQPILSHLQPNDVVYVESLPRKQFQNAITVIGFGSSIASIAFLIFTIVDRVL